MSKIIIRIPRFIKRISKINLGHDPVAKETAFPTSNTFEPYSKLPGEIRNHIWELSVPRRLVKVYGETIRYACVECINHECNHNYCTCMPCDCTKSCLATILGVNKEARSLLEDRYMQFPNPYCLCPVSEFPSHKQPATWAQVKREAYSEFCSKRSRPPFFNTNNDLFYIGSDEASYSVRFENGFHGWRSIDLDYGFCSKVKYAYIEFEDLRLQADEREEAVIKILELGPWLWGFPHLKRLFIVRPRAVEQENDGSGLEKAAVESLNKIARRHPDWKIPAWTWVENEERLAEIWEAWSK